MYYFCFLLVNVANYMVMVHHLQSMAILWIIKLIAKIHMHIFFKVLFYKFLVKILKIFYSLNTDFSKRVIPLRRFI